MYKKFLIIRLSSFGDIVLTFPLLKKLKQKYPECEIHFLTKGKFAQLLRLNKYITRIIVFEEKKLGNLAAEIRNENYSAIFDLHNNFRTLKLNVLSLKPFFKYRKENIKKFFLVQFKWNFFRNQIPVFQKYVFAGRKYCELDLNFEVADLLFKKERIINEPYIVIAPASRHFNKTYPKEKFVDLLNSIDNIKFVLVGENNEYDLSICKYIEENISLSINLCGKLNLEDLANVIFNSEYVICNDSGILHFSESIGKKVVAIFGATVKEFGFFPQLKESVIFENTKLYCRPCTHVGLSYCPERHFKCMLENEVKGIF